MILNNVSQWLDKLQERIQTGDSLKPLFLDDNECSWRDFLILSMEFQTMYGIQAMDHGSKGLTDIKDIKLTRTLETMPGMYFIFFTFSNNKGKCDGNVILKNIATRPGENEFRGTRLLTVLNQFHDVHEFIGLNRRRGEHMKLPRPVHIDEPSVLIIGAGQGGLMLCARFKVMGVHAVVIDQNKRVGDNWRKRYNSLVLHDQISYCEFPYMKYPETFPKYMSKDEFGDWLESYATLLRLDIRMGKRPIVDSAKYDGEKWHIDVEDVENGDVSRFVVHDIVLATGVASERQMPELLGAKPNFVVCHSSQLGQKKYGLVDMVDYADKRVVVVGAGNSGCDIAHTCHELGASHTTLVQRSSSFVVSIDTMGKYSGQYSFPELSAEEYDLVFAVAPIPSLIPMFQMRRKEMEAADKELLERYRRAGFQLGKGYQDGGVLTSYPWRGGGFYMDVGFGTILDSPKLSILHGQSVSSTTSNEVILTDGTRLPCDLLVFATGYGNMKDTCARILGSHIADQTTPVWGFDEDGFQNGIWKPSGCRGFWYMGGNVAQCRFYSKLLALQIIDSMSNGNHL